MNATTTRHLTIGFFVLLAVGAVSPMAMGSTKFPQWLEVVLGGLMSGVLYSLVAIGLVLEAKVVLQFGVLLLSLINLTARLNF